MLTFRLRPTRIVPIAVAFASLVPVTVSAEFVSPLSWSRDVPLTTFQRWDNFSTRTDAVPDASDNNPAGPALLTETTGTSLITSTGNLYSFSMPVAFEVTIPVADLADPEPYDLTAIVQVATFGNTIDTASPLINGIEPVDFAQLQVGTPNIGGDPDQTWYLFELPYAEFADGSAATADLILTFNGSASSTSLDQLLVDTALRPASLGFFEEPNPTVLPPIYGDFDGDGQVAQGDLNLVLNNWGSVAGTPAGWTATNQLDGTVDQAELNLVLNNWGAADAPTLTSGIAVPEPALGGVLVLGGIFALRRSRPQR
ncbi:MAG: hypothetical protein AAF916_03085 [Planctomycetota bacterium]